MSGQPVPSQLDQVLPRFYVQKAGPYHPFGRIRIAPFGKGGLRILAESGYIIRAEIDVTYKKPGMSAEDWFGCGINRKSEGYPSADAALIAARAAYNGPDVHGIGCWV